MGLLRLIPLAAIVGPLSLALIALLFMPTVTEALAWIGAIGSVASVIGVVFAIWQAFLAKEQARKAGESAERATAAVRQVVGEVQADLQRFLAAEAVRCFQAGDDHKTAGRWELAELRFGDCLCQLRHLASVIGENERATLDESIKLLSALKEECARFHGGGAKQFKTGLYIGTAETFWEVIRRYHLPSRTISSEELS